jgi:hypothetical protein
VETKRVVNLVTLSKRGAIPVLTMAGVEEENWIPD